MPKKKKYKFKEGGRISAKLNAQKVGEEIAKMERKHDGRQLAVAMERAARPKKSPMHDYFEWDNERAGLAYRIGQANHLIRCVILINPAPDMPPTRAFVSVVKEDDMLPSYTPIQYALSKPELRAQVIKGALDEARDWRRRYQGYVELAKIFSAIDEAAA